MAKRPGKRPVMMDIARVAGVSQKTVSRVVNGSPHVSAEAQARVTAAINELGFQPNTAARALVSNRSHVIGIVALGSALYGSNAQVIGVERAARAAGYSTLLVSTQDGTSDSVSAAVREIVARGVDGVVLSEPVHDWRLDPALLHGTPLVSMGYDPGLEEGQVIVGYDQVAGTARGTEHLLALGHETVHHLAGPPDFPDSQARADGWRAALTAVGAPTPPTLAGDWSARSGYEAGLKWARDSSVTAVLAANDRMAIGLERAFFEAGRRIPGDVSIVGFDDIPEAEFLPIPLTTLRQDYQQSTARAVAELLSLIGEENSNARQHILYTPELIIRQSSGPPPAR